MSRTWHNAGLRLSDEGLYSQGVLTHAEKVVLAAMLSPTARDETVDQLSARLPYSRDQVQDARAALQRKGVLQLSPIVKLSPARRAAPTTGRGRRVVWVDPRFDNRNGFSVFVPGEAVERVTAAAPRGATPALLLLMLYARVHARKKAVYVRDTAACNDLGLSMKQINRAKRVLRDAGLLSQVDTKGGTPVYVLSFMESDPASLIWEFTLTATTHEEAPAPMASSATDEPHDFEAELVALSLSPTPDSPSRLPLVLPLAYPHRQEDHKTDQKPLASQESSGRSATFEAGEGETGELHEPVYPRAAPF